MPLEYMEYSEPGFYWYGYVTSEYLPEVPDNKFACLDRAITSNRGREVKGVGMGGISQKKGQ